MNGVANCNTSPFTLIQTLQRQTSSVHSGVFTIYTKATDGLLTWGRVTHHPSSCWVIILAKSCSVVIEMAPFALASATRFDFRLFVASFSTLLTTSIILVQSTPFFFTSGTEVSHLPPAASMISRNSLAGGCSKRKSTSNDVRDLRNYCWGECTRLTVIFPFCLFPATPEQTCTSKPPNNDSPFDRIFSALLNVSSNRIGKESTAY